MTPAEVSRSVDKILPELLTKSGDTSARIHHMAVHTILTMADCKNVRWVEKIRIRFCVLNLINFKTIDSLLLI